MKYQKPLRNTFRVPKWLESQKLLQLTQNNAQQLWQIDRHTAIVLWTERMVFGRKKLIVKTPITMCFLRSHLHIIVERLHVAPARCIREPSHFFEPTIPELASCSRLEDKQRCSPCRKQIVAPCNVIVIIGRQTENIIRFFSYCNVEGMALVTDIFDILIETGVNVGLRVNRHIDKIPVIGIIIVRISSDIITWRNNVYRPGGRSGSTIRTDNTLMRIFHKNQRGHT